MKVVALCPELTPTIVARSACCPCTSLVLLEELPQHRVEFVPHTAAKFVPTAPNSSHHIRFKQLRRLSLQHMHLRNTPFVYDRIFSKMFVHKNFRKYSVVNGLSDEPSSGAGVY